MKNLDNEKGIALITALLLTMISLLVLMAVIYMVTRGVQVSAAHKRYATVLEASHGGAEVFTKDIIGKAMDSPLTEPPMDSLLGATFARYTGCFRKKLTFPTSQWEAQGCAPDSKTVDPTVKPDVKFTLQGLPNQANFSISSKIVDAVPGNSDTSGTVLLDSAAGVAYGSSGVSPQHVPALFRVEVQGEREVNPQEKARLSILYSY